MTPVSYKHVDVAQVTDDILNREGAQGWRLAAITSGAGPQEDANAPQLLANMPAGQGLYFAGNPQPFIRLWFWREEAR